MGFLRTVADDEATGEVAEVYRSERTDDGFISDTTRVLTTRPDFLPAWERFMETVRGNYSLPARDWRLITLIAAKHVPSTACSLAYGGALIGDLGSPEAVLAVQRDFRNAGLAERDVAMLTYTEQVATAPFTVTADDVAALRAHGFTDEQIFDVALCVATRHFYSRLIDAVGAEFDPEWRELEPSELRAALVVGRPLEHGSEAARR